MADEPDLSSLGKARQPWEALLSFLDEHSGLVKRWKFYGEKYGWQLKVEAKKRALVYLIPREGRFTAALALRKKAIDALREAGVSEELVREIEAAKEAPEGRPARVDVRRRSDVELVKKLVRVKLATLK